MGVPFRTIPNLLDKWLRWRLIQPIEGESAVFARASEGILYTRHQFVSCGRCVAIIFKLVKSRPARQLTCPFLGPDRRPSPQSLLVSLPALSTPMSITHLKSFIPPPTHSHPELRRLGRRRGRAWLCLSERLQRSDSHLRLGRILRHSRRGEPAQALGAGWDSGTPRELPRAAGWVRVHLSAVPRVTRSAPLGERPQWAPVLLVDGGLTRRVVDRATVSRI